MWEKQPGRGTRAIHGGAQHRRGLTTHVAHHFVRRRDNQIPGVLLNPARSCSTANNRFLSSLFSRLCSCDHGGPRRSFTGSGEGAGLGIYSVADSARAGGRIAPSSPSRAVQSARSQPWPVRGTRDLRGRDIWRLGPTPRRQRRRCKRERMTCGPQAEVTEWRRVRAWGLTTRSHTSAPRPWVGPRTGIWSLGRKWG
jgi:hypothetical protein